MVNATVKYLEIPKAGTPMQARAPPILYDLNEIVSVWRLIRSSPELQSSINILRPGVIRELRPTSFLCDSLATPSSHIVCAPSFSYRSYISAFLPPD